MERTRYTYSQMKSDIIEKLGPGLWNRIKHEIDIPVRHLWSSKRPQHFPLYMLAATLFKDLYGHSYNRLHQGLSALKPMAQKSLRHNIRLVRRALRAWADQYLTPSSLAILRSSAAGQVRVSSFGLCQLWCDTTEFRLTGKASMSRGDSNWSHKVNGPGKKWLSLHDGRGRTVFLAGPYSPKCYDADLLMAHAREIEHAFGRIRIIADNHFARATLIFQEIELICNFQSNRRVYGGSGVPLPRPARENLERWNDDVSQVRGRVEANYGAWQALFQALAKPFADDAEQLHCLVAVAAAVHRIRISYNAV